MHLFGGPDAPEGITAGPRNGNPPPPNKTRNTTGPAAPMGSDAPDAASKEREPIRKEGTKQGKRERGKEGKGTRAATTSPQAHKGVPPPIARSRQPFPSSQIRAKKSAKSRLG